MLGAYEEARALHEEARPVLTAAGARHELGLLLGHVALTHMADRPDAATECLLQARDCLRDTGDPMRMGAVPGTLGELHRDRGDWVVAL